jgi:hypothetical protein
MRTRNMLFLVFIVFALFSMVQISAAQSATDCPAMVQQALDAVAHNCAIPERSSTCYGFGDVTALNVFDAPIADFSQPADHADLLNLQEVQTAPLNLTQGEWGVAVTNIQANLPIGMPGQGGVLISIGDVRLENGVPAEEALILPESALPLTTTANAEIYNAPPNFGRAQAVVGATASGTTLQADGLSPDREWARVFFTSKTSLGNSASAWVNLSAFPQNVDVSSLPTITPESLTPMQKFYLLNGTEPSPCAQAAPSLLYVQGPEEIELDFIVNDWPIRVTSTALIRVLPPGNIMQVIAISGIVIVDPDGPEPVVLTPGFFTLIAFNDLQDLGVDGRANDLARRSGARWSAAALMNPSELALLGAALNDNIPRNLLYYDVDVPILVCASGVGSPLCEVLQPASSARIAALCALGLLPPQLCG